MLKKALRNDYPKISIIIPSFNKGQYISQTLQSIADQKYPNLEVIIQDGGSSDNSVEIIKKFTKNYPKIFQYVSRKDSGQLDAICKGIKKTTGEIITYINADDLYQLDALKKVAETFKQNQDAIWVTGFGDIIDQNGKQFSSLVTNYKNSLIRLNQYRLLLMVNYLTQPATFIRKGAYQKYGPFSGTKKYIMEYEFWLKLGQEQMPVVIDQTLASFRLIDDSISATSFEKLLKLDNSIAKRYTKNRLVLWLHYLHNLARIKIITSS